MFVLLVVIGRESESMGNKNEPQHNKTNKMTCAPSEDSDQPGDQPSLISLCCALNG